MAARDNAPTAPAGKPPSGPLPPRDAGKLWRAAAVLLGLLAARCTTATPDLPPTTAPVHRTAPSLGATDLPRAPTTKPSIPTPQATLMPIPAVSPDEHVLGPSTAPATLIVYSDFQCISCGQLALVVRQLHDLHPQELRVVFRHFPLLIQHDKASLAGQLTELAAEQGAFWPMHDRLFARRAEWIPLSPDEFIAWGVAQAEDLGLGGEAVRSGLAEGRYAPRLAAAYEHAVAMGLPSSPFLLLDGEPFLLPPELNYLEAAVRLQILPARQYSDYPAFEIDPEREYVARLRLNQGEIVLQLYPQFAPLAVNSFVFLADQGWFDGNAIYHVQPGVLLESGDPTGTGLGDPGYQVPMEPNPALGFDQPGVVALVPTSPDTNAGRFFISLTAMPQLNGSRTIFGRVLRGLELLQELPARDPLLDLLAPPDAVILEVDIEVAP